MRENSSRNTFQDVQICAQETDPEKPADLQSSGSLHALGCRTTIAEPKRKGLGAGLGSEERARTSRVSKAEFGAWLEMEPSGCMSLMT